jgi:hypothetical protein
MLLRAVDDAPMLSCKARSCEVDAVDPGIALGALHLAVDAVIVRPVLLGRKVVWSTKSGPLPMRARRSSSVSGASVVLYIQL